MYPREDHYAPYVEELRERTRRIMERTEGLEKTTIDCTILSHHPPLRGSFNDNKRDSGG
jgi:hypothetical protein